MKKNNLILGTYIAITAILFSSCGSSSSSESPSKEKVEIATEIPSTEKVEIATEIPSTEKVEGGIESTETVDVVTIGSQIWTSKNLDVETYRNGDVIPQVQDQNAWSNLTTGAWCYYNNDASNSTKYGKLYNWYAVNDPRGLAPNGYHIPTDAEWTKLSDYLGGVSEAGTKMKSNGGWDNDGNGTNSSGFSALPGGSRFNDGSYNYIGSGGGWWSSTKFSHSVAWDRVLNYFNGDVARYNSSKTFGFSVRCVRGVESSTESKGSGGVVTIGSQVWTSKNLNVATYRNGDVIPQVEDQNAWSKLTYGAWCYYNNDASNGTKYGKLYNWYAVADPRGLCPTGWHVPSDGEWTQLTNTLGGDNDAGSKMKSVSGWSDGGNGDNSSGFSGLPGCYRHYDGTYGSGIGYYGHWWSSSKNSTYNVYANYLGLSYPSGKVKRDYDGKSFGFSVRCVKN
jgi:uncharacterized protein (TIGR02145 family)